MQIKDKEIAEALGIAQSTLSSRKKTNKVMYEVIRLGAICKKLQISEAELAKFAELKALLCAQKKDNNEIGG